MRRPPPRLSSARPHGSTPISDSVVTPPWLEAHLYPNERVLWWDRAVPERTDYLIFELKVIAVIVLILGGLDLLFWVGPAPREVSWGGAILTAAVLIYMVGGRIFSRIAGRSEAYAITDQRAFKWRGLGRKLQWTTLPCSFSGGTDGRSYLLLFHHPEAAVDLQTYGGVRLSFERVRDGETVMRLCMTPEAWARRIPWDARARDDEDENEDDDEDEG